ncbi:MAG: carboxypeptidase regulatory-like domain-containing protein [Acidimicrobiia bacterium]|nr:carboxypeptidase regulatory-like domain-containing protein [Acidimicrobiia bacterium]
MSAHLAAAEQVGARRAGAVGGGVRRSGRRSGSLAASLVLALLVGVVAAAPSAANEEVDGPASVGEFTLYPAAIGRPSSITTGADGRLWISRPVWAMAAVSTDGEVTPSTGVGTYTADAALGPDGNLWLARGIRGFAVLANDIGRLSPEGVVTTYTDPVHIRQPRRIVAGPDGAMWFTHDGGLGRITVDGQVSGFTDGLGWGAFGTGDLAVGSDGALWTHTAGGVARITTAGVVTEFEDTLPLYFRVTAGPDGALWYSRGNNTVGYGIGRITTDGEISRFSDPAIGRVVDITTGPDGALWFVQQEPQSGGAYSIGRMTVHGKAERFVPATPLPALEAITVGPDGNIWFTGLDLVGRIVPPGPPGAIAGTVTDEGGAPLGGVQVLATTIGGVVGVASTTTAPDGTYELGLLDADDYVVAFNAPGRAGECYPASLGCAPATNGLVSVVSDQTTTGVDAALQPASGGSISGTVTTSDLEPVAGAQVWVFGAGFSSVSLAFTDAEGAYAVEGRPDGNHYLWFNAGVLGSRCYANPGCTWAGTTPVVITGGGDVAGVDAVFPVP